LAEQQVAGAEGLDLGELGLGNRLRADGQRLAAPRRARSGMASSARSALPNRAISWR
jgi:hypothetical protein